MIRRTIVIHSADIASFHISRSRYFARLHCGFALANFESAISCGRYLTPIRPIRHRMWMYRAILSVRYRATMTKSRGSGSVCSFALMCLQWLLRFAAYSGACIRVTYSRGNWRNWWIMVPRHAGYFETMFRFASRQCYPRTRDSGSRSQDCVPANCAVTRARISKFCPSGNYSQDSKTLVWTFGPCVGKTVLSYSYGRW